MGQRDDHSDDPTPRRRFLGRLAGGVAGFAALGASPERLMGAVGSVPFDQALSDDDWMAELKAKHRTVFDMSAHRNGKPLGQAMNYLDAWRDAFKVPERDVNLVIGIHGEGLPAVLTDATWARFKIGEQYEVMDAGTKAPAVRNVFSGANATSGGLITPDQSVENLQKRGVRFLICMNTIAGATRKLSVAGLGSPAEIRPALLSGLLPGVIAVPSMVVTLTQLQERGLRYVKIA